MCIRDSSSTGQASVRIHRLATSHGPVFLVNSRFSLVSAAFKRSGSKCLHASGPLLPKLRGHFAEFLNHDSLDRLSILYLTCLLYTSPSPRDRQKPRMPSSA